MHPNLLIGKAMTDFENQSDKLLSKILSRRSSVGCSSRLSYYRSGEGVPFTWEMQPGIAKDKAPEEEIPIPLTPPPALLSLGLPKPCIQDPKPNSTKSRVRFWMKRVRRGRGSKKPHECVINEDDDDNVGFDILARLDCSSDSESMASPRGSSFSSFSSMSLIKSRPNSLQSTSSESPTREVVYGRPFNLGCFPMRISRVIVSIASRGDH